MKKYNEEVREKILILLKSHNKKQLAQVLKISRQSLYNYMRELEIDYRSINKPLLRDQLLSSRIDELLNNK